MTGLGLQGNGKSFNPAVVAVGRQKGWKEDAAFLLASVKSWMNVYNIMDQGICSMAANKIELFIVSRIS